MALLWTDGFDLYGTASATIITSMGSRGYIFASSGKILDDAPPRITGNSLKITYTYAPIKSPVLDTTNATIGCGFGFKYENIHSTYGSPIFAFYNNADQIHIKLNTDAQIVMVTGSTNVATSTETLSPSTWYFIEWKLTVGANEAYIVKVNGDTFLSGNGNTQDGSSTYYNQVALYPTPGYTGHSEWYDDLYVFNGTSGVNDLLGDSKIISIQPDGDDSCNFATLSTGNDHYALVDDNPFDGDSTYVEDDTTGNRDLFTYGDTSDANTIHALSIITPAKRTDTNTINIRTVTSSNGTVEVGANFDLEIDYNSPNEILELDPDTSSAWTQSGVNSAKFGFEIV